MEKDYNIENVREDNNSKKKLRGKAKGKILKSLTTVLTAVTFALVGYAVGVESNTNHTEEWCPLNGVFGMQHQINEINEVDGYCALAVELRDVDVQDSTNSKQQIAVVWSKANDDTSEILVIDQATGNEKILKK